MQVRFAFVLALLFASSWAMWTPPMDAIPYCRQVVDGFTTDANGVTFAYQPYMCGEQGYGLDLPFAIFFNGQNTGLNASWNLMDSEANYFFSRDRSNNTRYDGPGIGIIWDLGPEDCDGGTGIGDGNYDTVDGAMAITFDGDLYGGDVTTANWSTTCSPTTASFTIPQDQMAKGLINKRTFYFPMGKTLVFYAALGLMTPMQDPLRHGEELWMRS